MDKNALKQEIVKRNISSEQRTKFINDWMAKIWTWKDLKTWGVCPVCNWGWYKWRIWIFEIMNYDDDLKNLLIQNKTAIEIENFALERWMINLERDWVFKAIKWVISLEDLYKIVKHKVPKITSIDK
jgi:type II secretory ATPase GspE/PulE/Tfp pilus assembly ATPase PilB-like protein